MPKSNDYHILCSWFLFHSKGFFGAYPFSPMFCPRWRTSRSRSGCCSPRQYSSAAAANFLGDGLKMGSWRVWRCHIFQSWLYPHEWRNDGMTKTRSGMEGMEVSYVLLRFDEWFIHQPSSWTEKKQKQKTTLFHWMTYHHLLGGYIIYRYLD